MTKAIILLSGGLDSTVMLAMALKEDKECFAISFDYYQKHRVELDAARNIVRYYQIPHYTIVIDPSPFHQSALTSSIAVPHSRTLEQMALNGIPTTYVPARNTIFLSYALGFAERLSADEIHFGANKMDRSCYPDCRPIYIQTFQNLINVATKQSVEGHPPQLITPLANLDKVDIIRKGLELEAPLDLSFSCYSPIHGQPCQTCDACILRANGFKQVNESRRA